MLRTKNFINLSSFGSILFGDGQPVKYNFCRAELSLIKFYTKCLVTKYFQLPGANEEAGMRFFLCIHRAIWNVQKPRMR